MTGETYRLRVNSLAIRTSSGGIRSTITIPSGAVVTVLDDLSSGKRLVKVGWNGDDFLMFADDLKNSEEPAPSSSQWDLKVEARNASIDASDREQALIEHSLALAISNEELERFAFVAAHDLRAPLRAIGIEAELVLKLSSSTLDERSIERLRSIVQNAGRMSNLIKDLLDFAMTNTEAEAEELDCATVVALALHPLQEEIKRTGSTIHVGLLPATIRANEGNVLRLFQNLIGNAIKYGNKSRPEITVSADVTPETVIFSVQDNGIGIDSQYQQQIFAPFQRLHGAAEYEGNGVGLAICKRVVETYHGEIWVESELGQGARFCFTIPDAVAQPIQETRVLAASQSGS